MTLFRYSKTSLKVIDHIFLFNYGIVFDNNRFDKKLKMEIVYLADKLYTLRYGNSLFEIIPEPNERDLEKSETICKDNYLDYISEAGLNTFNEIMNKVFYGLSQKKIEKIFKIYPDCSKYIQRNFMYRPLDMFIPLQDEQQNKLKENRIPDLFYTDVKVINYSLEQVKYNIAINDYGDDYFYKNYNLIPSI